MYRRVDVFCILSTENWSLNYGRELRREPIIYLNAADVMYPALTLIS